MGLRSALHSAETFPDTVQDNTDLSGTDFGQNNIVTFNPASASTAIAVAQSGIMSYPTGAAAQSGGSHLLGHFGFVQVGDSRSSLWAVGGENRVDNGDAVMAKSYGTFSYVGANAGTITASFGHYAQWASNSGTISLAVGHTIDAVLNTGTIDLLIGSYVPTLSPGPTGTITGITGFRFEQQTDAQVGTAICIDNNDPDAIIDSLGQIFGPGRQEISPPVHPGIAVNRYYHIADVETMITAPMGADVMYTGLFHVPHRTAWTRIGLEVTVGAVGSIRLGIYNVAAGIPTSLVLDCGTIDANTVAINEITIAQTLEAGNYALVAISDATPTVRWCSTPVGGYTHGSTDGINTEPTWYRIFTYAALPDPYGTPVYAGLACPNIMMRVV